MRTQYNAARFVAIAVSLLLSLAPPPKASAKRLTLRKLQRYKTGSAEVETGTGSDGPDACVIDVAEEKDVKGDGEKPTSGTAAAPEAKVGRRVRSPAAELRASEQEQVLEMGQLEGVLQNLESQPKKEIKLTPAQRDAMQKLLATWKARGQRRERLEEKREERALRRERIGEWIEYGYTASKKLLKPNLLIAALVALFVLSYIQGIGAAHAYFAAGTDPCGERHTNRPAKHCYRPEKVVEELCAAKSTNFYENRDCKIQENLIYVSYPPIYTPDAQDDFGATIYMHVFPFIMLLNQVMLSSKEKIEKFGGVAIFAWIAMLFVKVVRNWGTMDHHLTQYNDPNYILARDNLLWCIWNNVCMPPLFVFLGSLALDYGEQLPGGVRPGPVSRNENGATKVTYKVAVLQLDGTRLTVEVPVAWNKPLCVRDVRNAVPRGALITGAGADGAKVDFFQIGNEGEVLNDGLVLAPPLGEEPADGSTVIDRSAPAPGVATASSWNAAACVVPADPVDEPEHVDSPEHVEATTISDEELSRQYELAKNSPDSRATRWESLGERMDALMGMGSKVCGSAARKLRTAVQTGQQSVAESDAPLELFALPQTPPV